MIVAVPPLRNMAATLICADHPAHVLGVEPRRQLRRADQIDEHHRELPSLSSGGSVCSRSSFGRRSQRSIGVSRGEIGDRLQQLAAMPERNAKIFEIPIC